jgi:RHS repeat-associated protein
MHACRKDTADPVSYAYLGQAEVTATDAAGDQTTVFFNDLGLAARVISPLGGTSTYSYDNNGNVVSYTDSAGDTYQYTYDDNGNLTQTVNPLGQTVQMTYGTLGNLTAITDADNNTTSYSYDSAGNLLSITYPDGTSQSFTYDPLGNLEETIEQNGDPVSYQNNAQGLVTSETFADGTSQTFAYDAHGNLLTAETFDATGTLTGTTTLTYNAANELTSITYPNGQFLDFTYNAAGQRIQSVDQSGFTVNYTYDALGRLSELTDGSGDLIVQYTYNNIGELTEKLNGNSTSTTYAYDAAGDLTQEVNFAPGGVSINSSFTYTYNVLGEMTSMTDASGNVTTYGYDPTGQLTQVNLPGGQSITYVYNGAGDRTEVINDGGPTAYSSNSDNEITQVGSTTYTYDANGNLHTVTDASGTTTYTYNDLNQLLSITASDGTVTTFQYSPLGFLIGQTVNGTQTNYLVDPTGLGNFVSSYNGSGSLIADYIYGLALTAQTGPSGTGYYDFNASGNTVGITGASGTYVKQYSYLPFGETTTISATLPNPFTFAGQVGVMQTASNLFYMRARNYTPATGQFLSNDPIGLEGGDVNVRRYVDNHTTISTDPSGLLNLTVGPNGAVTGGSPVNPIVGTQIGYNFETGETFSVQTAGLGNEGTTVATLSTGLLSPGDSGSISFAEPLPGALGLFSSIGVSFSPDIFGALHAHDFARIDADTQVNVNVGIFPSGGAVTVSRVRGGRPPAPPPRLTPDQFKRLVKAIIAAQSHDPNALIGPAGFGAQGFIQPSGILPYTIDFENDGSVAAQNVTVTEQLSSNLDWSTFQLGSFGFGPVTVNVPTGLTQYQTTIAYKNTNGTPLDVNVSLDFNVQTGLLTVTFVSLDPTTGQAPTGVFDGFLPPDNSNGVGEGFVQYTIQPIASLTTGATITQQASVVFDTNPPLATDTAVNTIDTGAELSSTVTALPSTESSTAFTVSWSGTDPGGSGIAGYSVYVSENGGAFTPFLQNTTETTATFFGQSGNTYDFYSVATDNVGNIQPTPTAAQASTTVTGTQILAPTVSAPQTASVAENGSITFTDISVGDVAAGTPADQLTLSVNDGMLTLESTSGLSIVTGTNGSASFTVSGTSAALDATLASGLLYTPTSGDSGPDSLVISLENPNDDLTGSATVDIAVGVLTPTAMAIDAGGTYNGNPFPATATATGVGNVTVSGSFTFTYYVGSTVNGPGSSTAPTAAGPYTVVADFTSSDPSYSNADSAPLPFTIGQATPTVAATDAGGTYNGNPFPASAGATGVGNATVDGSFTFMYYVGDTAGGTGSTTAPNNAGTYTVVAAFTSTDSNYVTGPTDSAPVTFTIGEATPTVVASDAGGTSNGNPFPATATATGIGGATVNGSFTYTYYVGMGTSGASSSTALSAAGTYTVVAAFTSTNSNYVTGPTNSAPVTFTITASSGPIITAPATASLNENGSLVFSTANGNAISVTDAESGSNIEQLTLLPTDGTLAFASTKGLTISTAAIGSITVKRTLANLNAALNGLKFTPSNGFSGPAVLSITYKDLVTNQTATANVAISVNPIVSAPSVASVNENSTLSFSTASHNAITLLDGAASGNSDSLTLMVTHGTLKLASTTGLVFSGAPNGSAKFTVTGTLANLNAGLNGLVYTPTSGYAGSDALSLTLKNSQDHLTGSASVAITVNAPPKVSAPPNATLNEDESLTFSSANGNAISLIDAAAGTRAEALSLAVSHGTLKLASTTGLIFSGAPNGSARFTVTGTLANLNAALNGLVYTPTAGYTGSDSLSLSVKDSGDGLTGSASVAITVTAPASQPTVTVKTPLSVSVPGEPVPLVIEVTDTNSTSQAAAFTFVVSFGDGTSKSFSSKAPLIVNHVYTKTGTFTVGVTATDEFGHASKVATTIITVVPVAVETDPFNVNETALLVGGTSGNDTVQFAASGSNGIAVTLNGLSEGTYATSGPLIVFGHGGRDAINESSALKNQSYLLESAAADNVETDLDDEALQWAGLTAAMEIINA